MGSSEENAANKLSTAALLHRQLLEESGGVVADTAELLRQRNDNSKTAITIEDIKTGAMEIVPIDGGMTPEAQDVAGKEVVQATAKKRRASKVVKEEPVAAPLQLFKGPPHKIVFNLKDNGSVTLLCAEVVLSEIGVMTLIVPASKDSPPPFSPPVNVKMDIMWNGEAYEAVSPGIYVLIESINHAIILLYAEKC